MQDYLKSIIHDLRQGGINDIVVSDMAGEHPEREDNVVFIRDARSTAFFAHGKALKNNSAVAVILDGEFLSNILTVSTEAWFQKANLIIVALYSSYNEVQCEFFRRSVVECVTVEQLSSNLLNELKGKHGPVLCNFVEFSFKKPAYDYSSILPLISDNKLVLYNSSKDIANAIDIKGKHCYGFVSKYMGMLAVSDDPIYCLCSAECLMVDLNVFNNRYCKNRIRMIVLDAEELLRTEQVSNWIESNDIEFVFADSFTEDLAKQFNTCDHSILISVEGH
ncbi:MAG: hypothetical protein LIO87_07780 [Eubacterium sp.]|nr:hypothetical protein [Eubacterium sp.]